MEFYLFQLRSNEPGFKGDGLNEPDFKGVGLNTKPDFKDVGLDTNWTLRTPAWTIRREIRLLVLQGVSFLGFGTMVCSLALGLGYADMESGSFGDGN
ncbi:unnamed protein product [Rhizophagus irregularis]|uniref:Uncharacterized protein n=1 Tax=Rhizophagus irregularis TaxID=588596 RepID=A0A915ZHB2_9GLOM|nr:unnamed protein product [Rhizophagus irregularis]CAB5374656.1 unnamed protein product [Rhizophagus irregularis]